MKQEILIKKAELEKLRDQTVANLQAISGAITVLQQLLDEDAGKTDPAPKSPDFVAATD